MLARQLTPQMRILRASFSEGLRSLGLFRNLAIEFKTTGPGGLEGSDLGGDSGRHAWGVNAGGCGLLDRAGRLFIGCSVMLSESLWEVFLLHGVGQQQKQRLIR